MAQKFNCPNCGAPNQYFGEGNTVQCKYCGSDVKPPDEMVNQAAMARFWQKAKPWVIVFIIVTFGLPACGTLLGFGGTIIGILSAIAGFFASLIGG